MVVVLNYVAVEEKRIVLEDGSYSDTMDNDYSGNSWQPCTLRMAVVHHDLGNRSAYQYYVKSGMPTLLTPSMIKDQHFQYTSINTRLSCHLCNSHTTSTTTTTTTSKLLLTP
ncbi:hypothetical protein E2C01_030244 [Portunus trituberculatus]|uniref:Uncharacterized protein n=1 Tax=Portunus trituberculatus TaxID=210409 RepID=A0A5B7ETQ9_PORTR|nr:hypothetical protein [Portunus trituberculatus]